MLSVHGVATSKGVELGLQEVSVLAKPRLSLHKSVVKRLGVLEPNGVVPLSEGRLSEYRRAGVANTSRGSVVVFRMVVRVSPVSSLRTVSARSSLTSVVSLGDEGVVKSI